MRTWLALLSAAAVPALLAHSARSGSRFAGSSNAAVPPNELVGRWRGSGHIVANWTSQHDLPVDVTIASDGSVTGSIGDAAIASGRFVENRGLLTSRFVHSDYSLVLELSGVILKGDGIVRKRYRLNVSFHDPVLAGFGASEGSKSWPGASRESMARSMMLQVRDLVLKKEH